MLLYVNAVKEGRILVSTCKHEFYTANRAKTWLKLTMASMRLLVQQTKILGRARNLSRAVRSWLVALMSR